MAATVSLAHMVDLALGTPEVGAVNFNVLHSLLHAMLSKLNLSGITAELNKEDSDLLTATYIATDSGVSTIISDSESVDTKDTGKDGKQVKGKKSSPYHVLQKKVANLEEQMDKLNQLPSNPDLFDRAKTVGDGERTRPVSDMWQNVQLKNRVDANEEGVGKLMSLVEDLMSEMAKLKEDSEKLRKDMENQNIPGLRSEVDDMKKKIEELTNKINDMTDMDELRKRLKDLENLTNDLNNKFSAYPPIERFEDFVTWQALEEALKGIRDELEPKEKIVIEMQTQTSRASSAKQGPSKELQDMLEKLGILTGNHESLDQRVVVLEESMPHKANKSDLEGLAPDIPGDLVKQLEQLQDQLKALSKSREKDSDALSRMQQIILQLQTELDRLGNTAQKLIDDNNNKTKQIDNLITCNENLDRVKADKEYVQSEVDVKADKRLVEGKVNRSLFDQTIDELNRLIKEMLDRLNDQEESWKNALGSINGDIDGKLDRLEFGPIRDELERRLRALAKQLKELSLRDGYFEDDAAGIRKQLLKFQCISCDRPVDMMPQGPIPSIPKPGGLPATRSSRPYTTFELEQIRQHARRAFKKGLRNASNFERAILERQMARNRLGNFRMAFMTEPPNLALPERKHIEYNVVTAVNAEGPHLQPGVEVVDLYAAARACGGTHTMTHPHRRMARVTQYNNLFKDEEISPSVKEELDIQGADGHIYKGRIDARLPTTLQQSAPNVTCPEPSASPPKMSKVVYKQNGLPRPPQTAANIPSHPNNKNQRPGSARAVKPVPTSVPTAPVADDADTRPTSPPNSTN